MENINEDFLRALETGRKIFKFDNSADKYVLYLVTSTRHADHIELLDVLGEEETTLKISIKELLVSNCWFYAPESQHDNACSLGFQAHNLSNLK